MPGFKNYFPTPSNTATVVGLEELASVINAYKDGLSPVDAKVVTKLPRGLIDGMYKDIKVLQDTVDLAMLGELTIAVEVTTETFINDLGEEEEREVFNRIHCEPSDTITELKVSVWEAVVLDFEQKAKGSYDVGELEALKPQTEYVISCIVQWADGSGDCAFTKFKTAFQ